MKVEKHDVKETIIEWFVWNMKENFLMHAVIGHWDVIL